MTRVEFVRELDGVDWKGSACLVKRGDDYFVVSSVIALYSDFETLAFRADKKGQIVNWVEVAGGRGASREDVIAELSTA